MAEKTKCPSCQNKRTIECPCCSGKGCVAVSLFPPQMGKIYICADCVGAGKIPCPTCAIVIDTKHSRSMRLREIQLYFGQA